MRLNDVNYVKLRWELHVTIQILEIFSDIFLVSISREKGNHEFSVEGVTSTSIFIFSSLIFCLHSFLTPPPAHMGRFTFNRVKVSPEI